MEALALHIGEPTVLWEDNTSCISIVEAKKVTRSPVVNLTLSANHPVHPCAPVKSSAHAYASSRDSLCMHAQFYVYVCALPLAGAHGCTG